MPKLILNGKEYGNGTFFTDVSTPFIDATADKITLNDSSATGGTWIATTDCLITFYANIKSQTFLYVSIDSKSSVLFPYNDNGSGARNVFQSIYVKKGQTVTWKESDNTSFYHIVYAYPLLTTHAGTQQSFGFTKIAKYSLTPSLTQDTGNLIKTIAANTLSTGYYLFSVDETYNRSGNRSWFRITGDSGKIIFIDVDSNEYTDVRYEASGYSRFVRSIPVNIIDPNTEIKFYLWGNGYSPNNVTITINRYN